MDHKWLTEMLNPVRMKIVQLVMERQEITSRELAGLMPDVPIASLYRHIKKLIALDILQVASETPIRGTVERTLRVNLQPFAEVEKAGQAGSADDHFRLFYSFVMALLADFSAYTRRPGGYHLEKDMVGFRSYPLYMNEEESVEFFQELGGLVEKRLHLQPDGERRLRKFSFVALPADEGGGLGGTESEVEDHKDRI